MDIRFLDHDMPLELHKRPTVDPATLPENYLVTDPNRRPGYIDDTAVFLDAIDANIASDPQGSRERLMVKSNEMQSVLNSAEWDSLDPVFKSLLVQQMERVNALQARIETEYPSDRTNA